MPLVATHELNSASSIIAQRQVYCGLDSMLTREVFDTVGTLRHPAPHIYDFEKALQAPLLEIMLRGFKVDEYERQKGITQLREQINIVNAALQEFALTVWDKPLNANSPTQLKQFFYETMRLPEQWQSKKGKKALSTDREALEKLEHYFYARPIVSCILAIRDLRKKLSVLASEVDADGRMRTSYNMSTETGRLSSSASSFGTGQNLQNITPSLRKIFIADDGWKLCGIDLEQTESHDVGWLHGTLLNDWTYLDLVEAGDVHTQVCKMVWQNLAWTGDKKKDREIADSPFYRDFTYRDMAKRGGHACNYKTSAWTMSRALKIPMKVAEGFQESYYGSVPGFFQWYRWIAQELQTKSQLTTPFGRVRQFFGRPNDDNVLREAIAFVPQSTTADRMNLGLWRIWRHGQGKIQLLAQVHDAVYFQYRPEMENEIIPWALKQIEVPMTHEPSGRTMTVRGEAKIGWNWGNYDPKHPDKNPDGLMKWSASKPDTRVRAANGMGRMI